MERGKLLACVWIFLPWSVAAYQAPEDQEDIFGTRSCPAFLVFDSAAYLADMTVELPCHCKPAHVLSVVWYYQRWPGAPGAKVLSDFSGHTAVDASRVGRGVDLRGRFSIRLFSLVVFRVQPGDAGHYLCGTESGEFFYGYDLDVQEVRRVRYERSDRAAAVPAPPPLWDRDERFRVFTDFWPWSVCDRCGAPGEQVRIGLCRVASRHLQVRYLTLGNASSCGSSAVPRGFGLGGGSYGAELCVRACRVPCPPRPTDPRRQALLEFLGHGGVSSSGIPIYYHNHAADTDLVLSCPGTRPEHAVAWDRGSAPLHRSRHMRALNPDARVSIDPGHHLHFRPVRLADRGAYFCWIQGRRAAEVRLGVYSPLGRQRGVTDPEAAFALTAILLSYAALTALFLLIVGVRGLLLYRREARAAY